MKAVPYHLNSKDQDQYCDKAHASEEEHLAHCFGIERDKEAESDEEADLACCLGVEPVSGVDGVHSSQKGVG